MYIFLLSCTLKTRKLPAQFSATIRFQTTHFDVLFTYIRHLDLSKNKSCTFTFFARHSNNIVIVCMYSKYSQIRIKETQKTVRKVSFIHSCLYQLPC